VVPYVQARNLGPPDRVIISHGDNDHAGGVEALARRFPAAHYSAPDPAILPAAVERGACRAGQHWHWDGVDFQLLHPAALGGSSNDTSCVLRIRTGSYAVLLPGDIERAAERRLLQESPEQLRADLLIAPHHGSKTSSAAAFLAAVAPS